MTYRFCAGKLQLELCEVAKVGADKLDHSQWEISGEADVRDTGD